MSENVNEPTKVEGKGMGVAGFVIALVGIVLAVFIAGISTLSVAAGGSAWLIWFWTVMCAGSVVLSAMGMMKLGKTGGKKGLAIAGLVIGIVATVWSLTLALGVQKVDNEVDKAEGDLQELRDRLNDEY